MKYTMTKPCPECPFRNTAPIRLRVGRIEELAICDRAFQCHKTVDYDGEEEAPVGNEDNAQHCAGALIFAEKNGLSHQMMRIVERLGMYDHTKLEDRDEVWDDVAEWLVNGSC